MRFHLCAEEQNISCSGCLEVLGSASMRWKLNETYLWDSTPLSNKMKKFLNTVCSCYRWHCDRESRSDIPRIQCGRGGCWYNSAYFIRKISIVKKVETVLNGAVQLDTIQRLHTRHTFIPWAACCLCFGRTE